MPFSFRYFSSSSPPGVLCWIVGVRQGCRRFMGVVWNGCWSQPTLGAVHVGLLPLLLCLAVCFCLPATLPLSNSLFTYSFCLHYFAKNVWLVRYCFCLACLVPAPGWFVPETARASPSFHLSSFFFLPVYMFEMFEDAAIFWHQWLSARQVCYHFYAGCTSVLSEILHTPDCSRCNVLPCMRITTIAELTVRRLQW